MQIAVDSWDRPRLLEDVARTFAEHGANIVSYGGVVEDQLAKNWYTAEVGDVKSLRSLLTALRNLDAVFDAYRVTPSSVGRSAVSGGSASLNGRSAEPCATASTTKTLPVRIGNGVPTYACGDAVDGRERLGAARSAQDTRPRSQALR